MSLKDELKDVGGNRRRFLLLRISVVEPDLAKNLCHIKTGTYNTWCHDPDFVAIYRRRDELCAEYKKEAMNLLRRDNQLAAVLLEEKIIERLKDEINSGDYNLLRTNLAREVYSKLIADLDINPQIQSLTWEQRINNLNMANPIPQIEGGTINGEYSETVIQPQAQLEQGIPVQESKTSPIEVEEEVE